MDAAGGGCRPRPQPFVATSEFIGRWKGMLRNGGAEEPVHLQVDSSNTFARKGS